MSDCHACGCYAEHTQRAIDDAGHDYHTAMTRIRGREAEGLEVVQLTRISPDVIRAAQRTEFE